MKGAISAAVTTYACAAGAWNDRDTETIAALRRELHAMSNRAFAAEGALQLIAIELGLPETAAPVEIVAAVRGRR